MRSITVRIRAFQIVETMGAVGRWLGAHGVMPAIFQFDKRSGEMLVVRMEFARDNEADAFAGAFRRAIANRPRRDESGVVGKYPRRQ
jgi:hypothetical protein